ncbi:hypothetical protein [Halomicronema hongdechloris]|nr:hypothetical protein [Halomicronema hongdechloris]
MTIWILSNLANQGYLRLDLSPEQMGLLWSGRWLGDIDGFNL